MEVLTKPLKSQDVFLLRDRENDQTIFSSELANKLLEFSGIDKKLSNLIILHQFSFFKHITGYLNVVFPFRINDIRHISKFLIQLNKVLPRGGKFYGYIKLKDYKKQELYSRFSKPLGKIIYSLHYLIHRVAPKLPHIKKLYFYLTKGKNRMLSKTEILGRLYAAGFKVINELTYKDHFFFEVKKTSKPLESVHPSYGPLIRLKRVGKDGKIFNVYKLRTMYPYSEFLQEYIYKKNHLDKGGKFKNDFRVTTLGKLLRKYWIDELPMLINLLKDDMKLVGVRPLSQHYYNLYDEELKLLRIKFKPGLLPPYYADMPETLEEIIESEKKYLIQYQQNPVITDIKERKFNNL